MSKKVFLNRTTYNWDKELFSSYSLLKNNIEHLKVQKDLSALLVSAFEKIEYPPPHVYSNGDPCMPEWQSTDPTEFNKYFDVTLKGLLENYTLHQWDNTHHLIFLLSGTTCRISQINKELRLLRQRIKFHHCPGLLTRVKELVKELHSLISTRYDKAIKSFKKIRIVLFGSIIRNIRLRYRQIIQFVFKNLPDFSGCEEDSRLTFSILKSKPVFFNQSVKLCITPSFYLSPLKS